MTTRAVLALAATLAVPTLAVGGSMTSAEYNAAKDRAATQYKAARDRCDALTGNAKDVCLAEAKAVEVKAKAEAEASYKNTDAARRDARMASAEAQYGVAKAKCDTRSGNDRDVCLKEAKAAEVKAKADAKADATILQARREAHEDKLDADYKVALERCEALPAAAKEPCIAEAKARLMR